MYIYLYNNDSAVPQFRTLLIIWDINNIYSVDIYITIYVYIYIYIYIFINSFKY